jgi:cell division septum initiation protein DivIVA
MAEPHEGSERSTGAIPPESRAARARQTREATALERVRQVNFPIGLRGYERTAVDRYIAEVAQLVAELEARQLRETVVQRALEEVGEQTSGILQRAHETADDITTRSRRQADARLEDAEQHAETVRREAEAYADAVMVEARRLWGERQRLLDEMRQFADEVLTVADDALERLPEPPVAAEELRAARRAATEQGGAAGELHDWAGGEAAPAAAAWAGEESDREDVAGGGERPGPDEDTASYELEEEADWDEQPAEEAGEGEPRAGGDEAWAAPSAGADPESSSGADAWDEPTLDEELDAAGAAGASTPGSGEQDDSAGSNGMPETDDAAHADADGEHDSDSALDDATREFPAPGPPGEPGAH